LNSNTLAISTQRKLYETCKFRIALAWYLPTACVFGLGLLLSLWLAERVRKRCKKDEDVLFERGDGQLGPGADGAPEGGGGGSQKTLCVSTTQPKIPRNPIIQKRDPGKIQNLKRGSPYPGFVSIGDNHGVGRRERL
jgi:hypothetical protein